MKILFWIAFLVGLGLLTVGLAYLTVAAVLGWAWWTWVLSTLAATLGIVITGVDLLLAIAAIWEKSVDW
jgi:hypothetical protein